jgi:hypothetical protein
MSTLFSAQYTADATNSLVAYTESMGVNPAQVAYTIGGVAKPSRLIINPEVLSCLPSPQSSQPATPDRDISEQLEIGSDYDEDRNIRELTPEEPTQSKGVKRCDYCKSTQTPMWRHGPGKYTNLCNSCGVKWRRGKILSTGEHRHHLCKPLTPKAQKKRKESKSPKTVKLPTPTVTPTVSPAVSPVRPPPQISQVPLPEKPKPVVYDPVPSVMASIQEPAYSRLEILTNDFSVLLDRLQPQKTQEFISTLTHGYSLPFGEVSLNVMDISEEKWDRLRALVW